MIRFIAPKWNGNGKTNIIQIACLSTDTKPTENVATGSLCLEVNTGKIYAFDEVSGNWNELG